MKRSLASLALLLLLPLSAHAWWDATWTVRKKITIDTAALAAAAGAPAESQAVAVRLHSGNFLFTDAKPDGADLRFVAADDKTVLKHHVETFDAGNQLAVVWVQLPALDAKAVGQPFWMYSGNAAATPAAAPVAEVFGPAQRLRLDFNETDAAFKDGSGLNSTVAGEGVSAGTAGVSGGAAVLAGKPLVVTLAPAALAPAAGGAAPAGWLISAWVKPTLDQKAQLWAWGPLTLEQAEGGTLTATLGKVKVSGTGLAAGEWQHITLAWSDRLVLLLNGREIGAAPVAAGEPPAELRIGNGFRGEVDMLELARGPSPALWSAVRAAQGQQGRLLSYGEAEVEGQEAAADEHSGYIAVLMNSLTLDAKIVIVILSFMFAISVYVMVSKTMMISRVDSHNGRFLVAFEDQPQRYLDPKSDESQSMRNGGAPRFSSLARLYGTGMRELDRRSHGASQASLSAEAVAAIKASIDSTLIRENQKLNRLMVLLTIAISGGPFLGLLGTVVGVMITFAAIAASGDVNINSIAPGIAAALLATVAGLGVAIPSLFGYNYLITRIKNITADMQAFSDEFITRMAEAHNN